MLTKIFPSQTKTLENGQKKILPTCPDDLRREFKKIDEEVFAETGRHRYVDFEDEDKDEQ